MSANQSKYSYFFLRLPFFLFCFLCIFLFCLYFLTSRELFARSEFSPEDEVTWILSDLRYFMGNIWPRDSHSPCRVFWCHEDVLPCHIGRDMLYTGRY
jgi:hypothetical protein